MLHSSFFHYLFSFPMNRFLALGLSIGALCIVSTSCANLNSTSPAPEVWTDARLFDLAKSMTANTWYKKSDAALNKGSKSGHTQPLLRTRYNPTAVQMLDATSGKVKAGAVFADGSIIVKELLNADRSLSGYALMVKQKSDPSADAQGWVWGYLAANGTALSTVTNKGAGCIGCHSISGHIDNTLMNFDHP
jgi:hypothetical protein